MHIVNMKTISSLRDQDTGRGQRSAQHTCLGCSHNLVVTSPHTVSYMKEH